MADPRCVAVAYSGGRDSTALLHATIEAARAHGAAVVALHVHHGLQPAADEWLAHCRDTCRRWSRRRGVGLRFVASKLEGAPSRGESVEAWARRERYRALRRMALEQGADIVLLGHHLRDQAETFLLQALRGGGVAGLAAMPARVTRDGMTWARPWLGRSSSSIDAYVKRHRLRHVEDASNADPRFARNRLRRDVWPALNAAFPDAESCLASAAGWAAEANDCLAALASIDLAGLSDAGGLSLDRWSVLAPARRSNALRAWLAQQGLQPPAMLVRRLLQEVARPGVARWTVAGGELRRFRGRLEFVPTQAELPAAPAEAAARPACPRGAEATLRIGRAGRYRVPGWPGHLDVRRVRSGGVALAELDSVAVAPRRGGETFQLGPGRPARPLKKQYQALAIAPWEREGPLLWCGDRLVYAFGLGIDARALAPAGEPQVSLQWVAKAPDV